MLGTVLAESVFTMGALQQILSQEQSETLQVLQGA